MSSKVAMTVHAWALPARASERACLTGEGLAGQGGYLDYASSRQVRGRFAGAPARLRRPACPRQARRLQFANAFPILATRLAVATAAAVVNRQGLMIQWKDG